MYKGWVDDNIIMALNKMVISLLIVQPPKSASCCNEGKMEHTPLLASNVPWLCIGINLSIIDQSQLRLIGLNIDEHITIQN